MHSAAIVKSHGEMLRMRRAIAPDATRVTSVVILDGHWWSVEEGVEVCRKWGVIPGELVWAEDVDHGNGVVQRGASLPPPPDALRDVLATSALVCDGFVAAVKAAGASPRTEVESLQVGAVCSGGDVRVHSHPPPVHRSILRP